MWGPQLSTSHRSELGECGQLGGLWPALRAFSLGVIEGGKCQQILWPNAEFRSTQIGLRGSFERQMPPLGVEEKSSEATEGRHVFMEERTKIALCMPHQWESQSMATSRLLFASNYF